MRTIAIHWGKGNHAQDIISRGIFDGFHVQIVEVGDEIPVRGIDAHMIFLPIWETQWRILELLEQWKTIINFSGIQGTTPIVEHTSQGVSNIHFLFGPGMQGELKASLASAWWDEVILGVLQNIEKVGIHILEHSREEHDQKVAITQGLAHALFLALSEMHLLPSVLFERWKNVPATTSGGMIGLNPFVKKSIEAFIESVKISQSVRISLQRIVWEGEVDDFVTPNFERIFKAILWTNGPETNMDTSLLNGRWEELIDHLFTNISLDQKELQKLIANTRNGN